MSNGYILLRNQNTTHYSHTLADGFRWAQIHTDSQRKLLSSNVDYASKATKINSPAAAFAHKHTKHIYRIHI